MSAAWTRKEGQNPDGGLNAKGRAAEFQQGMSNLSNSQFNEHVGNLYSEINSEHPDVKVGLQPRDNHTLHLDTLIVPKEKRGQGIGSQIVGKVTDFADKHGLDVSVNPSTDFGSSLPDLQKFYGKHGFTGKGDTMTRKGI